MTSFLKVAAVAVLAVYSVAGVATLLGALLWLVKQEVLRCL